VIHLSADIALGPGQTYAVVIGDREYLLKPGFAELALNTGAPVIPVYGSLEHGLRTRIDFWPPLDPGRGTRDEQIERLMKLYEAFVNERIRKQPESITWKKMRNHLKVPTPRPRSGTLGARARPGLTKVAGLHDHGASSEDGPSVLGRTGMRR